MSAISESPYNMPASFVEVEGHRIAYTDTGEGTPLLLIHGIPTNRFLWRKVIQNLARHYRVIAPDMLNYGESAMPIDADVSVNAQARIMIRLMDSLDIESAHVVSHDIGGAVSQIMAVNHPQRVGKHVLIDSVCFDSWPIPEFETLLEPGVEEKMSVEDLVDSMNQMMPKGVYDSTIVDQEMKDCYITQWSTEKGKAALFRNMRRLNKEYTQAIAGEVAQCQHDTLVLWGEHDNFQKTGYASQLVDLLPNARLIWIAQAGHWVIDEKPGEVCEYILSFLAD